MKKTEVKPSPSFLKELVKLESDGERDEVCQRIANWCYQMSKTSVVVKNDSKWNYDVTPSEYAQNVFIMYRSIFCALNRCHQENGNLAFEELRDKAKTMMDEDMVFFLGGECYKAFDEHDLIY